MGNEVNQKSNTLCWDCKKAIGGCSWSNRLKPVKGWAAIETTKNGGLFTSYHVKQCPNFVRDAYNAGSKRKEK